MLYKIGEVFYNQIRTYGFEEKRKNKKLIISSFRAFLFIRGEPALLDGLGPVSRKSRKAICEIANGLFWKADLVTCFQGNKKKNN